MDLKHVHVYRLASLDRAAGSALRREGGSTGAYAAFKEFVCFRHTHLRYAGETQCLRLPIPSAGDAGETGFGIASKTLIWDGGMA